MAHVAEIDIAHRHVLKHSARRGYHNVGTSGQRCALTVPLGAVVAAINGCRADRHEVTEAFHLLVNLNGKLACRHKHHRVDAAVLGADQPVDDRKQIGGRLAGAGLCAGYQVFTLIDYRNSLRLDGRGFLETHGFEAVHQLLVEIEFVEFHYRFSFCYCFENKAYNTCNTNPFRYSPSG